MAGVKWMIASDGETKNELLISLLDFYFHCKLIHLQSREWDEKESGREKKKKRY